ncbi:hypothetical protein EVAR_16427_1 [Eumeta japonica]|uniref:Uncharacterized protein n=1 Tax=Eumeta variegata TaxID=151549 RepID=A0A4C1UL80_EUMVA|nr:hypothetical protein EVAR_16427_1 [Eumeta japonica]
MPKGPHLFVVQPADARDSVAPAPCQRGGALGQTRYKFIRGQLRTAVGLVHARYTSRGTRKSFTTAERTGEVYNASPERGSPKVVETPVKRSKSVRFRSDQKSLIASSCPPLRLSVRGSTKRPSLPEDCDLVWVYIHINHTGKVIE